MSEKDIIELHDELYKKFMEIHKKDNSFRFRVRRMNNQNRLEKGYWFNGNLSYLETSFWDYKDNLHQTPIIRLVYVFETEQWGFELVARDENFKERRQYFNEMAKSLGDFTPNDSIDPTVWKRELKNKGNSFLSPILSFIGNGGEKEAIDAFIEHKNKENFGNKKLVDFIAELAFEKDIARIESTISNQANKEINISLVENTKKIVPRFPFSFKSIEIKNFQGIEDLVINDGLEDSNDEQKNLQNAQWIFLTGENGFGKTSILKAISVGLTNDENNQLKDGASCTITGYKNGIEVSNAREDKSPSKDLDFENVVAYGVSRFRTKQSFIQNEEKRTSSLFDDNTFLLSIIDVLQKNTKRFKEISDKLKSVMPNIDKIERKEDETGNPEILFYEKGNNGEIFKEPVTLDKLGAGYRGIFTMMGDMIIRLTGDLTKNVNDIAGIVLIDEVDAHLHPKYQYDLPKLLTNAFPKVQFIVSTHSPMPLLGLPKKNQHGEDVQFVIINVNKTSDGIEIDRLDDDFDIRRLNPNALLTSPIFGFQEIFASSIDDEDEKTEPLPIENFSELERLKNIRNSLKQLKAEGIL